ncbi:MAG: ABC transporter ATP-binding protein/permease [Bacilli bacterium]|nr:ABC transporter ATP-binding protein/permease [Bacilli bacterium]
MYRLVNVSKQYSKQNVLHHVTLTFPTHGLVAIVGKSGSGKSTLLNLLSGIDHPTTGTVMYGGDDLNKFNAAELKTYQNEKLGILFQHFNLFNDLTSMQNVVIPALIKGEKKAKAYESAAKLFKQYHLENLKEQKYGTLSGGEKQRVALLRALINHPEVILADEPTGALDSKNSILVMDELKKLAKDYLVIVVSHNDALIRQYEDYRINIVNGNVSPLSAVPTQKKIVKHQRHSNHLLMQTFLKLHLSKHRVRNLISLAAISFSTLSFLLSVGYINGSNASRAKYEQESLLYNSATIAKKTIIELPNSPIKISKLSRPNDEELTFLTDELASVEVVNNYQTVFPNAPVFIFDQQEINDIDFAPVYDFHIYQDLLITGKMPSPNFQEIIVNTEFINRFGYQKENIIGRNLRLSSIVTINSKVGSDYIKDIISYSDELTITGVVEEFAYLNMPRVYYSYLGLQHKLKNTLLVNYSHALGYNATIDELVSNATSDDPNSGYAYYLFIKDIKEMNRLYQLKVEHDRLNDFDIASTTYLIAGSYEDMTNIIATSLVVFLILTLLATLTIIIIASYSNYTQNKQESAILSVLGAKRNDIFSIFNAENLLVAIVGLLLAFILAFPMQLLANQIIANAFHLTNLIVVPFISYLSPLIILSVLLLTSLAAFIPFMFYEKNYILEELKDE